MYGEDGGRTAHGGRWVVGVDGSRSSIAALGWTIANARRCGAQVVALHVHEPGTPASQALRVLDIAIDAVRPDDPSGPRIGRCVVGGSPKRVLVGASATAGLLVVGRDGEGRAWPHTPGSIARHCVMRAESPIAVVPPWAPASESRRVVVPAEWEQDDAEAWARWFAPPDGVVRAPAGEPSLAGRTPAAQSGRRIGWQAGALLTEAASPDDVLLVRTEHEQGGRAVLGATATWLLDVAGGVVVFLPG